MKQTRILIGWVVVLAAFAASAQTPQEVTFEKDVVYGRSGDVDLKMDLAKPATGAGPFPALVCIHGGAWHAGDKAAYEPFVRQFAAAGYVAAAVGYRFAPAHKWPAQIEDVKCAVRFLRAHAKELNIDPGRIGAMGDSAGGHLALLLGLMDPKDGLEGTGGHPEQSSKAQAVVNFYGPTDMRTWSPLPQGEKDFQGWFGPGGSQTLLESFTGTSDRKAPVMAQVSPVTFIDKHDPPVLTFHGTKDPVVQFEQGQLLHKALEEAGVSQKLVTLEGEGHGFGGEQLASTLKQTIAFFDRTLKGTKNPSGTN